jgi:hypothetical protein
MVFTIWSMGREDGCDCDWADGVQTIVADLLLIGVGYLSYNCVVWLLAWRYGQETGHIYTHVICIENHVRSIFPRCHSLQEDSFGR